MKNKKRLLLLMAFLSAIASAEERVFEVTPVPGIRIEYVNGTQFAIVDGSVATVAVSFVPENHSRGWIAATVQNRGAEPFNIQETALTASVGDVSLKTFTYVELMKSQKHKSTLGSAMSALYTTAAAYNSGGHSYGQAAASGATSVLNQGTPGSAAGQPGYGTPANGDQVAIDQLEQSMVGQLKNSTVQARSSIEARALRDNTVRPGQAISGQVCIELPDESQLKSAPLVIDIAIGDEIFRFPLREKIR